MVVLLPHVAVLSMATMERARVLIVKRASKFSNTAASIQSCAPSSRRDSTAARYLVSRLCRWCGGLLSCVMSQATI